MKNAILRPLTPQLTYICHQRGFVLILLYVMSLIIYSLGQLWCAFVFFSGHLLLNLCYLCKLFMRTIFYKLGPADLTLHFVYLIRITTRFKIGIALNRPVWLSGFGDILLWVCFDLCGKLHVYIFLEFFCLLNNGSKMSKTGIYNYCYLAQSLIISTIYWTVMRS